MFCFLLGYDSYLLWEPEYRRVFRAAPAGMDALDQPELQEHGTRCFEGGQAPFQRLSVRLGQGEVFAPIMVTHKETQQLESVRLFLREIVDYSVLDHHTGAMPENRHREYRSAWPDQAGCDVPLRCGDTTLASFRSRLRTIK